ncbi:MAG: lipoyl synthase [Candidatus Margulisbacteria bacterium]|nr:lipoyl synthase [Candidatus Margulisiibacteriota bacterium]
MPLPHFLVKKAPKQVHIRRIRQLLEDNRLNTVCESAKCPNIGECFGRNTLTFMIMGNLCTRHCRFCGVDKGKPLPLDETEPERIASAVKKLGLNYVVITSVTRDDLPDGGASQFAAVIKTINQWQDTRNKMQATIRTEVLIPDFQGNKEALKTVLDADPFVLSHNLETVPRLYPQIRPEADYRRSLELLERSKKYRPDIYTKSGFMLGLGEEKEEVISVINDLKMVSCDLVTIGQYLPPSKQHPAVSRYATPEEFKKYQAIGQKLGIKVFAGPFVRSSYQAGEMVL